jgi:hypothetical protein
MNTMAPTRRTEPHACRVRLDARPSAAAEARRQIRTAIHTWHPPVDPDIAILLTSDLVTDAIRHQAGGTVTLAVRCARGRLRVDVCGTSCSRPAPTDVPARLGLILVARLSAEWGHYRTPAGSAVYFTLALFPGISDSRVTGLRQSVHLHATSGHAGQPPSLAGSRPCQLTSYPAQHRSRHACGCSVATHWRSPRTPRTPGAGRWS